MEEYIEFERKPVKVVSVRHTLIQCSFNEPLRNNFWAFTTNQLCPLLLPIPPPPSLHPCPYDFTIKTTTATMQQQKTKQSCACF